MLIETAQYTTLNDAYWLYPELAEGDTEIWYQQALESPFTFDPAVPEKTHVLMGKIREADPERIFYLLQGEIWSPHGEANAFVCKKLLRPHTSMSVCDIVIIDGIVYAVDRVGFTRIEKPVEMESFFWIYKDSE